MPGPRADIPWIDGKEREIAGSGPQPIGGGPRLLTPLVPVGG